MDGDPYLDPEILWTMLHGSPETIDQVVRDIVANSPEAERATIRVAMLLYDCFHEEAAFRLLRKSCEDTPSPFLYNALGRRYLVAAQWHEAASAFHQVLKENPQDPGALDGLGIVALNRGRFQEAISLYTRLVETGGAREKHLLNYSEALVRSGEISRAFTVLLHGLESWPFSRTICSLLLDVLLKRSDSIVESLRTLVEANGENPSAVFLKGILYLKDGNLARALECYTFVSTQPGLPAYVLPTFRGAWKTIGHQLTSPLFSELDKKYGTGHTVFSPSLEIRGRSVRNMDIQTDGCTVIAGIRQTVGTPTMPHGNIHIIGASQVFGTERQENTISSLLQGILNSKNIAYAVHNHGAHGTVDEKILFLLMKSLTLAPGDVVILHLPLLNVRNLSPVLAYLFSMNTICFEAGASFIFSISPTVFDVEQPTAWEVEQRKEAMELGTWNVGYPRQILEVFHSMAQHLRIIFPTAYTTRPRRLKEVFQDRWHYNFDMNRIIAEVLFEHIHDQAVPDTHTHPNYNSPSAIAQSVRQLRLFMRNNRLYDAELNTWLERLRSGLGDCDGTTGAIVMNANPFTRGHLHLIEQALEQVDRLIVFVVEEDKSTVPF
ncbi:MAG: tetratricopeptide repeat protein, partial [Planctomycetes bacterium]|nr:tetratricopeptide repeat protein [Planctomycetota bacterium]